MEFLIEGLLQLLAPVLEVVAEALLQVLFEAVASVLGRALHAPWRPRQPVPLLVAVVGYQLYGAALGGLSLWLAPHHLVPDPQLRLLNLLVTPLVAGAAMAALGAWRVRRGQAHSRLESFTYGSCFALAMALVRWQFAR